MMTMTIENELIADDALYAARIVRVGDTVVNLEVVTQEWLETHTEDPYFYWVVTPDKDGNEAIVGLHYDPHTGLFQQPTPVDTPPAKGGKKK